MGRHNAESTVVKLGGLRSFSAQMLPNGMLQTRTKRGQHLVSKVLALQASGAQPHLQGEYLLFQVDPERGNKPARWLSWIWVVTAGLLLTVVISSLASHPPGLKTTDARSNKTCIANVRGAKVFALSTKGHFLTRSVVNLGGVTVLSIASTCSTQRYKITLDASAKRVISVSSD